MKISEASCRCILSNLDRNETKNENENEKRKRTFLIDKCLQAWQANDNKDTRQGKHILSFRVEGSVVI